MNRLLETRWDDHVSWTPLSSDALRAADEAGIEDGPVGGRAGIVDRLSLDCLRSLIEENRLSIGRGPRPSTGELLANIRLAHGPIEDSDVAGFDRELQSTRRVIRETFA